MKKYENGKIIGIIGSIWCFGAIIISLFISGTIEEFFVFLAFYSILGTIMLLISLSEFSYIRKKNYLTTPFREKLNDFNIVILSFVNIPLIFIIIKSLVENGGGISEPVKLFFCGPLLFIVILKLIQIMKD